MQMHPPKRQARPSQMDRESFVAAFGDVFEHSPWVAEGAYALELGPTHDTARGIHQALTRVFRADFWPLTRVWCVMTFVQGQTTH